MARPSLVRADTLDLQDHEAPHAAEHTKLANASLNGIAPHQAAQYQQVAEERHSEEQALATAWAMAGSDTGEPASSEHDAKDHRLDTDDGADAGADTSVTEDDDQDADDDLMDRISSSPSIDDEDIDFEFVYALHTFVATVEGQANATKGDTMVLLDDSNSYWWLVRVVKDSSIGYLPAEHIETPTERLARLNKHRNIDLSQSMLGDVPEKSRNPLKIAMRRRNAKTVQFAAPTYVEASDYEYSDDEEQVTGEVAANAVGAEEATNGQPAEVEERNAPEEANVHATRRHSGDQTSISSKNSFDSSHKASFDGGIGDDPQLSPKLVDRTEAAPLKSRKGTPRNTDSFLKDDGMETRKITLTPGILREDGSISKSNSLDSQRNPSMESLTKVPSPSDSTGGKKDSKDKKKDKQKGGMLSGLFKSKKKDKKGSKDEEEERVSMDTPRGSSPLLNGNTSPVERNTTAAAPAVTAPRDVQVQSRAEPPRIVVPPLDHPIVAELQGSEVAYEMVGTVPDVETAHQVKRAQQRMELDDFDTPRRDTFGPDHDRPPMSPTGTIVDGADFVHIPMTFNDDDEEEDDDESIQEITTRTHQQKPSVDSQRTTTDDGTELFADARDNMISPPGHRASSSAAPLRPVHEETPARGNSASSQSSSGAEAETPKSASVVSHDSKHTWDDGALRAWLDAEEVRDMLTIVQSSAHVTGQIEPVSDDHPLMRGLYVEERGAVDRMMTQLDTLLMGFASRRGLA